jgi:hypothetical protein
VTEDHRHFFTLTVNSPPIDLREPLVSIVMPA